MKKNLLCAALILLGLDGLHAFNPFTAMANVARGESGCQTSLVDKLARGLPNYEASRNSILTGPALKSRQAFEKDMAMLHRCIGNDSDRDQQVLLGKKLREHHPKLTEKVASVCSQDSQFRRMFPNQCAITGKAKSGIDRAKGIKRNAPNTKGNKRRKSNKVAPKNGVACSGQQPNYGNGQQPGYQMQSPPAYGYAPAPVDPMQQYQHQPQPGYQMQSPPAYRYAPAPVDPMQQYS